jgi:hypothetical protein
MPSPVTAVGRLLQPRNGEPRRHRVIAVAPSGKVRTVIDREVQAPVGCPPEACGQPLPSPPAHCSIHTSGW